MNAPSRRTFVNAAIILGMGLFALGGVSAIGPLRDAERAVVKNLALKINTADSAFGGEGSQEKPWRRWETKATGAPETPRFLTIDDDPERYFSASPPSPVDCAVIFARLREANHRVVGSGYLMAWDEPDPLGVLGLHKQMDRFDAVVLGLPLARGAAAEPVAEPFLRESMLLEEVEGNTSGLPVVNRIAVPNAELGGERTRAGFTLLENEADVGDGRRYMLARWHDRIIFSLPLATEIASLGISTDEIQVTCGKEIRLGQGGPVIPIDEYGRTPVSANVVPVDLPATDLIEVGPVIPTSDPLILRDVRADLPDAEKAYSDQLAGMVQALRSAPRYEQSTALRRPGPATELALILLIGFFGAWATALRGVFWRVVVGLMVAAFGAELIWLLASRWDVWLPPFAVIGPSLAILVLGLLPQKQGLPAVETAAPLLPEPLPPAPMPLSPAPEHQAVGPAVAAPITEQAEEAVVAERLIEEMPVIEPVAVEEPVAVTPPAPEPIPEEPVIEIAPAPVEPEPPAPAPIRTPQKPAPKPAPAKKTAKKSGRKPPKKKGR